MNYNQQYFTNFEGDWNFISVSNTQEINDDYYCDFPNEYFSSDFQSCLEEKEEINLEELDDFNRVLYNTFFGYEDVNNNNGSTEEDCKEYVFPYNGALYSQDGLLVEPVFDSFSSLGEFCGYSPLPEEPNESFSEQIECLSSHRDKILYYRRDENIPFFLNYDSKIESLNLDCVDCPTFSNGNNNRDVVGYDSCYIRSISPRSMEMDLPAFLDEQRRIRKRKMRMRRRFEGRRNGSNNF